MTTTNKPRRPTLRYFGGKWQLADWIISYFPPHRIYMEPFGGGGSVLLQKPRAYAEVYNDIDDEVVNLFRVYRDCGPQLIEQLARTPFSRTEYMLSFGKTTEPIERARRMVIRSFMGFASNAHNRSRKSGFRACSNRSGTAPAMDWKNYPACLSAVVERLQGVVIENTCAMGIMTQHDTPQTLHYIDPPYLRETRTSGEYAFELTDTLGRSTDKSDRPAHARLAKFLKRLDGMVIVSGYDNDFYDKIYSGWLKVKRPVRSRKLKAPRTECLWLSPNITQNDLFASEVSQ